MNRLWAMSAPVLLMAPMLLAGVHLDYDHSANFERYQSFAWKAARPNPTDGIVNNSLVAARIRKAVDRELSSKGMTENRENPDVYLTYHLSARRDRDFSYFPSYYGWGWRHRGWWVGPGVFTSDYLEGNLVIDMIDAHTSQLVWRAYGTDTGSYVSDLESAKNIDRMVARAFKQYPPEG